MDAFDGPSSDAEETQVTQVLDDLLGPKGSGLQSPETPGRYSRFDAGNSAEISQNSESFNPHRNSNSIPTYHFHGLAATQPELEEDTFEEGSQKENIQGSLEASVKASTPFKADAVKASKGGKATTAHSKSRTPNGRPIPISSLTPAATRGLNRGNHPPSVVLAPASRVGSSTKSVAPPSPVSSNGSFNFARPADLATNRRSHQQTALNQESESPSNSSIFMYGYSKHGRHAPPEAQGNVLVDATPETSQQTQSQQAQVTEPFIETQLVGGEDEYDDRNAPASSYGASLYAENLEPDTSASGQTQAASEIATQLSTQPATPPAEDSEMRPSGPSYFAQTHTTGPLSGPRSLVGLVDPAKQWRYAQYVRDQPQQQLPSPSPQANDRSHVPETQLDEPLPASAQSGLSVQNPAPFTQINKTTTETTGWEETQPTTQEDLAPPPRPNFSSARSIQRSQKRPASVAFQDDLEIVPGSEAQSSPERAIRRACLDSDVEEEQLKDDEEQRDWRDEEDEEGQAKVKPSRAKFQKATPSSAKKSATYAITKGKNKKRNVLTKESPVPSSDSEEEGESDSEADSGDDYDERPAKRRIVEVSDDDEDEDVPLANATRRATRAIAKPVAKSKVDKGKGRAEEAGSKPVSKATTAAAKATTSKKVTPAPAKATTSKKVTPAPARGPPKRKPREKPCDRSWETGIVPSSIPEEREPPPPTKPKSKGKGKAKAPPRPSKRRVAVEPEEEEKDEDEEEEQPQDAVDVDDQATELAGDEHRGVEASIQGDAAPDNTPGPSGSNKRKRKAKAAPKTDEKPPAKKITRGALASAKKNNNPTRVIALWKQDNHYYTGTVYCTQDRLTFTVKFDDGNEAPLDLASMRALEFRVGDEVTLTHANSPCDVTSVAKFSQGLITVFGRGVEREVEVGDIRVANRTVKDNWADRQLVKDDIVPELQPRPLGELPPTPGSFTFPSSSRKASNRKNKPLSETGLVLTLGANTNTAGRTQLTVAVDTSGGVHIDDLTELFGMTGKWDPGYTKWVIEKEDVKFKPKSPIRRLFVLSDEFNQKPKYLLALALGIPCLSTQWLLECVKDNSDKEWLHHLLPQGYSDYLGARLSQQIDMDWGSSSAQLAGIMDNHVAMKVFEGASILCLGKDMMPMPKNKKHHGQSEQSQKALNSMTCVILCMGADRVEAAIDVSHASYAPSKYTYIVTKTACNAACTLLADLGEYPRERLVNWEWVKACLIANRLLPPPGVVEVQDEEHSQEA